MLIYARKLFTCTGAMQQQVCCTVSELF